MVQKFQSFKSVVLTQFPKTPRTGCLVTYLGWYPSAYILPTPVKGHFVTHIQYFYLPVPDPRGQTASIFLRPPLCTYHRLSQGLTPGTPPGNPREHAGNGAILQLFLPRRVGTLFSFGNEHARPPGCTPGICSTLVSGISLSKSRMNLYRGLKSQAYRHFVCHFYGVCSMLDIC